jgi:hypothetical protein
MQFFSKAQFNMFSQVAQGIRKVAGLTRTQAQKDIKGKSGKGLPKRVSSKKK